MSSSHTPTIGRVVWLWLSADTLQDNEYNVIDEKQALKAEVCFVNPDGTVTLDVCDHSGECGTEFNVTLFDFDEHQPPWHGMGDETIATWMPYQMKKHAEESAVPPRTMPEYPAAIPPSVINPTAPVTTIPVTMVLTDGKDV